MNIVGFRRATGQDHHGKDDFIRDTRSPDWECYLISSPSYPYLHAPNSAGLRNDSYAKWLMVNIIGINSFTASEMIRIRLAKGQSPLVSRDRHLKYFQVRAKAAPSGITIWLLQCACLHSRGSWVFRNYHANTCRGKRHPIR